MAVPFSELQFGAVHINMNNILVRSLMAVNPWFAEQCLEILIVAIIRLL